MKKLNKIHFSPQLKLQGVDDKTALILQHQLDYRAHTANFLIPHPKQSLTAYLDTSINIFYTKLCFLARGFMRQ
jgi:hypothetical protein